MTKIRETVNYESITGKKQRLRNERKIDEEKVRKVERKCEARNKKHDVMHIDERKREILVQLSKTKKGSCRGN